MSQLLTVKQVARALGVSESSLKRWCDDGRVPAVRTAGGHRRLRQDDIVQLVRRGELTLTNPESLGLPPTAGRGQWTVDRASDCAKKALLAGDYEGVRQAVFDLYLCGHSLATICDRVLAPAMWGIGSGWDRAEVDVYEERRATCLTARVLYALQQLIPRPLPNAPLALGGTVEGDPYTLATQMAELSLAELGWRATSLGGPLPFSSLVRAIDDHRPRLFWVSVSLVPDIPSFVNGYHHFYQTVGDRTAVVVGGRGLTVMIKDQLRFAAHCENMAQLVDFAKALQPQPAKSSPETSAN